MRTTVRLDDRLLREAKSYAASRGQTLTSVLEEALRRMLAERGIEPSPAELNLPVSGMSGGVLPGVDLDDSDARTDLMDA